MSNQILVLMYHHITPIQGPFSVHPDVFKQQLLWLKSRNYRFHSAETFEKRYLSNTSDKENEILITFDDGWVDNWFYAIPILEELNIPAVLFVVSSWPGDGKKRTNGKHDIPIFSHYDLINFIRDSSMRDKAVMRWSEINAAIDKGVLSVQSHSYTHGEWWIKCDDTDVMLSILREDLIASVEKIYEKTGIYPTQLCWPRGEFTLSMKDMATKTGLRVQYSVLRGGNIAKQNNERIVRRINVENKETVNKSIEWFKSRIIFYSNPVANSLVGLIHQFLFNHRMKKKYPILMTNENAEWPLLNLV